MGGHARNDGLVSAIDDRPHPRGDHRFWHETWWFSFYNAERRLGGWVHHFMRPNIPLSGGGCYVWDDSAHDHMEVPYYLNHSAQPMPEFDGNAAKFPSGTTIETLEALKRYRIQHKDRDWIDLDVEWEAVMPPWVTVAGEAAAVNHWEHIGRVSGRLVLHGEEIPLDCLAIRDRSWGPRQERWKDGIAMNIAYGAATPGLSFLHNEFLVIDGVRRDLRSTRTIERDPEHGYITRVSVEGVDSDGRRLVARGKPLSRMAMPLGGVHGVVWTSLIEWNLNGVQAWGEDQDIWSLNRWSEMRRLQRAGRWTDRPDSGSFGFDNLQGKPRG